MNNHYIYSRDDMDAARRRIDSLKKECARLNADNQRLIDEKRHLMGLSRHPEDADKIRRLEAEISELRSRK